MRLVSLESLSSVEYGIKKVLWFSFFKGSYRGLNIWENRVNAVDFIHIFRNFLLKFSQFRQNLVRFYKKVLLILFSNTSDGYFWLFFLLKILAKYFKIQTISSKVARNKFL